MKKHKTYGILVLSILILTMSSITVFSNQLIADKEFVDKLSTIVTIECEKAFEKYNSTGVLKPSDLTDHIIPLVTGEIVKKSLPLILEKKIEDTSETNLVIANINGEDVTINKIRYDYLKMPNSIRQQIKDYDRFIKYMNDIFIIKHLFLKRAETLNLKESKEIKYQLKVAFDNMLVEQFIRNKQMTLNENLKKTITKEEIEEFYRTNLEKFFQIPPRITLSHIVKKCDLSDKKSRTIALEMIEKAYKDLESGVSFEKIQEKYSDDNNKSLGVFKKDKDYNDPVIERGQSILLEGKYSEIVQGKDGFYILLLKSTEDAHTMPLEKVKSTIISTLVNKRTASEIEEWISELKKEHKITIYENIINKDTNILKPDIQDPEIAKKLKLQKKKKSKPVKHDPKEILATIDDFNITRLDFDNYLQQLPEKLALDASSPEGKMNIITRLINKKVILLEALKNEFQFNSLFLNEYEALEHKILSKNLIIKEVASKIDISDEDIEKYFKRNNEEVKARHILFSTPEKCSEEEEKRIVEKAKTVLEKANSGEDFANLAETYSDDPSRVDGGFLGYFTHDVMEKPFADKAFSMKKGEISDLVKTVYGYHIIKLEDRRKKILTPEVKKHIKNFILLPKMQKKQFDKYVKSLKKKAKIKFNEENIRIMINNNLLDR